jgi:hypothetical protein
MGVSKGERREAERFKRQHGMKVSNRSIMVIVEVIRKGPKRKKGRKRERLEERIQESR